MDKKLRKKNRLLLISSVLIAIISFAILFLSIFSISQFKKIKTWGGSDYDNGHKIALDSSGNIYITGATASYGAGSFDVVLLKYNSSGNLQWSKIWGGPNNDTGDGIALDNLGNIYITGATSYETNLDDVFLLKYDSSGNLLWNKTWGGYNYFAGGGIALDS
ncbi:unnamed protein product, partial [marine sediment metagenome]